MGWAPPNESDTDQLLKRAEGGDDSAVNQLMRRHRHRLREMVRARLDPRMAKRVDPSDVVQETLTDAYGKLPQYLRQRPLPFYPWLRQLAWERLAREYRRHVRAAIRLTVKSL